MAIKIVQPRRRGPRIIQPPTPRPKAVAPLFSSAPPSTSVLVGSATPLLSVLVPTIFGREAKLQRLMTTLRPQVEVRKDVELITTIDGRGITIGRKRNLMISSAKGEYVVFVDDDDLVTNDYIETIVTGLSARPDVLCFLIRVEGYGPAKMCRYGLRLVDSNLPHEYQRRPNHLMVWRREIAKRVPFPDVRRGEDSQWAKLVTPYARTEVSLDRMLYTYQYDANDNSAQAHRR